MKHPNKKHFGHKAKFLAEVVNQERHEQCSLFRFANVAYIYHKQAEAFNPNERDFEEWLTGLPENTRINMEIIGHLNATSWKKMILAWITGCDSALVKMIT